MFISEIYLEHYVYTTNYDLLFKLYTFRVSFNRRSYFNLCLWTSP